MATLLETPDRAGTLSGTEATGLILTEYVNIERKTGGVWTEIAGSVPAAFEPVHPQARVDLEAWTHKPLFWLWLPPSTPIQDGDRAIRFDGTRWYVRGTPLIAPLRTHVTALVEGVAEDGLFAARSPAEPA